MKKEPNLLLNLDEATEDTISGVNSDCCCVLYGSDGLKVNNKTSVRCFLFLRVCVLLLFLLGSFTLMAVEKNKGVTKSMKQKKVELGQFFTKEALWLKPQVLQFIKSSKASIAYDPFAGGGDLLKISSRYGINKIKVMLQSRG